MIFALASKSKQATSGKRAAKRKPAATQRAVDLQSGLGVHPTIVTPTIQTKLKIGEPNDEFEQEADRVAEEVMRMPNRELIEDGLDTGQTRTPKIQRACKDCEEEIQRQPIEKEDEELIQSKAISSSNSSSIPQLQTQIQSLKSEGQPLSNSVRSFFEPRFNYNFDRVMIHTGTQANIAANKLGARAFTVGNDIVLGSGQYSPETTDGQKLLAHELTHIIQQGQASPYPAGTIPTSHAPPTVMPYRSNKSANFGACDTSTLQEESFSIKSHKTTKPWIEAINIQFDGETTDADGDLVPTGKLTATYFGNSAKLSKITASIVGGKASAGLTNQGSYSVKRIEGCGYHHTGVPKAERIEGHKRAFKYFKNPSKALMSFAVFFLQGKRTGNQAIHKGSLTTGSLACVHISDSDRNVMQQINYHSVRRHTKVKVSYSPSPLQKLCCERFKVKGYMVSNPCRGQDPKKCP